MKGEEIKDKVLKYICEHDALIDGYPKVFPCTCISKYINESVYKVRKCMKELESDGYVKKSSEGGFDDGSCEIYCIHGYSLTEKGHNHKYYKDALEKEIEWWNKQNKKEEVEE